jgi:A/G-specific adenine glycosylase
VDPDRPGDFNQALMEHGALVCTPRSPGCRGCPLSSVCLSLESGTVDERPLRKTPKGVPRVDIAVLVAAQGERWDGPEGGGSLLLRKRPPTGLLAGMWEFPGWEVRLSEGEREEGEIPASVLEGVKGGGGEMGLPEIPSPVPLAPVTHAFSHLRATYWPLLARMPSVRVNEGSWTPLQDLEGLALPVAQEKILALALKALGSRDVATPPPSVPERSGPNPGPAGVPRSCSPP